MAYAIGAESKPRAKQYVNALAGIVDNGGKTGVNPVGRRSAGVSGVAVTAGYNGYFKLYLISETVNSTITYKVRIANGSAYVDETTLGGNSICKVNNVKFEIAPYLSSALTISAIFYLEYDSSAGTVVISTASTLPEDTSTKLYYQLGRFVYVSATEAYTIQDHTSGLPPSATPQLYFISSSTSASYSGYFKLYLISETVEGVTGYRVRVADGKTYVDETNTGGNSTCKVNENSFSIAPYFSGILTANTLFYLLYQSSTGEVTLESHSSTSMTIPNDTDTEAYYQLGRFYTGTTPYIAQDHSNVGVIIGSSTVPTVVANGIPQIWWTKNEC